MDQQITPALFNCRGGPVQSFLFWVVYWLHTCIWNMVYDRRIHPLKPAQLWLQSPASCWYCTLCSQLKNSSIKAKETCLSLRKCIARLHHTSLVAECLLCFGLQTCPDVETDSSQMYVSLVSLSIDAWTQTDVSARCYRRATGELYLLKRRWTICSICSLLLWSNCLFSAVGDSQYSVVLGACP